MKTNTTQSPILVKTTLFLLTLLIALSGWTAARAEGLPATSETTATVSFIDGDLELGGEVGGSGLHFDFGSHALPAESVSYAAQNTSEGVPVDHVLPVVDTRYVSGDWYVTVALTSFDAATEGVSSFDAQIKLNDAVLANANASAGTSGLTVENDIAVTSGLGAVGVMSADETLSRGLFTATWTNDKVKLNISDAELLNIGLSAYSAKLSWTLNLGPQ